MKQYTPVFPFRVVILGVVIAVLCVSCTFVIPISLGGRITTPENSAVSMLDSAEIIESYGMVWSGNAVFNISSDDFKWENSDEGIVTKYNRSLQLIDSSVFPLQDDKWTIRVLSIGKHVLLLNEYNDGDSMGVIARRFDSSVKLQGGAVRIAQSVMEGDDEKKPRSRHAVELSPDSSVFCVWNTAYKEDDAGRTLQISVCNKELEVLQHRVVSIPKSVAVGHLNVDNTGAVALVRMDTSGRMVCQRFVSGRNAEEMELKIPSSNVAKRRLISADVVCSNENEWTTFSLISPDTSNRISSIVLHSCNWTTGEARVLTEYELTKRDEQKITNRGVVKGFQIHDVLTTKHGFVVWNEAVAEGVHKIYGTKTVINERYTYSGPITFFAFDKQGYPLWQRTIARNAIWYRSDKAYSAVSIHNDTLRVLYEYNNFNDDATASASATLNMRYIALSTGEMSLETPILTYNGYAHWKHNETRWLDPQTLLLRCYESNFSGSRMFTIRANGR